MREYAGQKISIKEAIDLAVEDCIKEGIQEGIHMVALLAECLERDGRLQDLKLLSDNKEVMRLYKEYKLADIEKD